MPSLKKLFRLLLALAALASLYVFLSSERNQDVISSKGFIDRGSKFGVTIGQSKSVVDNGLRQRGYAIGSSASSMKINGSHTKNHCYSKPIADNLIPVIYYDNTWRRGSLCVVYLEEKVKEIHWWYDMFAP